MEELIRIIRDCLSQREEIPPICESTKFSEDLGLTSLDVMVILCQVERAFDTHLPLPKLMEVKTVKDLYELLPKKT